MGGHTVAHSLVVLDSLEPELMVRGPTASSQPGLQQPWAAVVFVQYAHETLLIKNSALPCYWQPVGGRAEESDRSPAETAARELFEEVGIRVPPAYLRQVGMLPSDVGTEMLYAFSASLSSPVEVRVDNEEVIEWNWFPTRVLDRLALLPATLHFLEALADEPD